MDQTYLIIGGAILGGLVVLLIFVNSRVNDPSRVVVVRQLQRRSNAGFAPLSQRVKDITRDPARKIEAIKAYREETGAGLKDAKDAIENWIASPGAAPKAAPDGKWRSQSVPTALASPLPASAHIARDPTGRSKTIRKIEAIKAYREETGAGLKDAKDAVESWLASQGLH